jgi:hypothetical protein
VVHEITKQQAAKMMLFVYVGIFVLLLLTPLIQLAFRPFPGRSVNGVAVPENFPTLRVKSFLKESFQKGAEDWFLKKNGLWGLLVRANNQLNYSLFGQVSTSYTTTILVGKDKHLFQPMYLPVYNRSKKVNPVKLETRAKKVKLLQDLLAARGVALVILVSTDLISLYPELVPAQYSDPTRLTRKNSYEIMRPLLDNYQINYVDGHEFLQDRKTTSPIEFFEPTGSHWNSVASCMVTNNLVEKMQQLTNKKLVRFACEPYSFCDPPREADLDLVQIANLLYPSTIYRPSPVVEPQPIASGAEYKPKLLFVGTSFVFSVIGHLKRNAVTEQNSYYFYYRKVQDPITGGFTDLPRDSINWEETVLANDVIVLEINQAGIGNVGFGFLDDAIENISKIPPK